MAGSPPGTRLRVVLASHRASLVGGAERSIFELAVALERDGRVDPVVAVPSDAHLAAALRAQSVRGVVMPVPSWTDDPDLLHRPFPQGGLARRGRRTLVLARDARIWARWLRTERPDVVLTSTATIPAVALASALVRIPHVWWVHEFVTRDHGLCYLLGEPFSQRSIGWLSTRVVVSSRSVEEHFSPPIRREKMCLVYYGIAGFDASPNRADLPALRVLLLGRQTPTKGQKLALEAAGILGPGPARIDLRLVGSITPAYREELQRIASALGISDRVEIVDASSTPENELAWANVVLMCSDHEASGRVTVEALKSGRPVVGTRTGGTPELISDGVNGFLFAPGSAQELAAALRRVASEPGLLERLSEGARASVEDRFTIEAEVDDFVDVLEAAVARGNRLRSPRRRGRLAP